MVSDGLEFFLPPTLAEAAFVYGSGFVVGKGVSGYRYLRGGVTTHTAESIVVQKFESKFWKKADTHEFFGQSNKVYKRDDLIDLMRVDDIAKPELLADNPILMYLLEQSLVKTLEISEKYT